MRGTGNHTPPALMAPPPATITETEITRQVTNARNLGAVINTETAREIAAWFQSPYGAGTDFERFAGAGEITVDLQTAIRAEVYDGLCRHEWVAGMMYVSDEDVEEVAAVRPVECEKCERTWHNRNAVQPDSTVPALLALAQYVSATRGGDTGEHWIECLNDILQLSGSVDRAGQLLAYVKPSEVADLADLNGYDREDATHKLRRVLADEIG